QPAGAWAAVRVPVLPGLHDQRGDGWAGGGRGGPERAGRGERGYQAVRDVSGGLDTPLRRLRRHLPITWGGVGGLRVRHAPPAPSAPPPHYMGRSWDNRSRREAPYRDLHPEA